MYRSALGMSPWSIQPEDKQRRQKKERKSEVALERNMNFLRWDFLYWVDWFHHPLAFPE